jgi:hypothetical protein
MAFLSGDAKVSGAKPTPVTPRLSDSQIAAKEEAGKTRKRRGLEDNILSLGRRANTEQQQRQGASLLGRTAA